MSLFVCDFFRGIILLISPPEFNYRENKLLKLAMLSSPKKAAENRNITATQTKFNPQSDSYGNLVVNSPCIYAVQEMCCK